MSDRITRPYLVLPRNQVADPFNGIIGAAPINGLVVWAHHPRQAARDAVAAGAPADVVVMQVAKLQLHGLGYTVDADHVTPTYTSDHWSHG